VQASAAPSHAATVELAVASTVKNVDLGANFGPDRSILAAGRAQTELVGGSSSIPPLLPALLE
jgi:hypothetical protein